MSDNIMVRERPDVGSYEDIVAAAERTTGMSDFGGPHARGGAAGPGRRPRLARGRADAARQLLPALGGQERAGRRAAHPGAVRRAPRAPRRADRAAGLPDGAAAHRHHRAAPLPARRPDDAGAGDVADAVSAAPTAARDVGAGPDLQRHAAGVHRPPRREPRLHGHPLHGCDHRRGVLAAAAPDRQVQLLRGAGQPAALLAVAAGPGLDRRLRAAQAEPPAGRPQRPREALDPQEPLAHDRARRADDRLSRRAHRLHPPRPGHLHRLVGARSRPRPLPATRTPTSAA